MVYNCLKNKLESRRLHKVTILSVEDDKGLQGVIQHYMEEDGHTVLTANSGKELKELLAKSSPIDIILMDLTLPDAEGISLIPVIRASTNVPIIIVSGKTDSTEKIVGLEMGADDYITKPFEMRELAARIKAVIRRSGDQTLSRRLLRPRMMRLNLCSMAGRWTATAISSTARTANRLR
jgi:DNA-binding response OmpR family regulator